MYVIARGAKGRATLQHKLGRQTIDETVCGLDIRYWSRAYQRSAIPQVICRKCRPVVL